MSDPTIDARSIALGLTPTVAITGRALDEAIVAAWVLVLVHGIADEGLAPITVPEFNAAVRHHMLTSRFPITPSDVWAHVKRERLRIRAAAEPDPFSPVVAALPGVTLPHGMGR